ncbi:hypothetical protein PoB_006550800 [Plakobranchus ocellatus]|uniref:Uncharacterized protein n=1 Tax=Plakobranchus ocellatus TaxID=259542 RepID=A0AAV4D4D4_9GAST|nr:hypothetical protein PoB_006550800 [Plakobranchus ocellatus]
MYRIFQEVNPSRIFLSFCHPSCLINYCPHRFLLGKKSGVSDDSGGSWCYCGRRVCVGGDSGDGSDDSGGHIGGSGNGNGYSGGCIANGGGSGDGDGSHDGDGDGKGVGVGGNGGGDDSDDSVGAGCGSGGSKMIIVMLKLMISVNSFRVIQPGYNPIDYVKGIYVLLRPAVPVHEDSQDFQQSDKTIWFPVSSTITDIG